uniref:Tyrosine--tRNA ligase n=1 Tax=Ostreococcus mediterraneus TaxID=1486918 RepID=A0A7S0KDI6_9CHLO|mmetsp:Transcript_2462/g.9028  ORF Transcript_2462/g.9028 Transcript_2462/m.9028 type:complete len:494 (+) Transcript_2462:104-1585(+)
MLASVCRSPCVLQSLISRSTWKYGTLNLVQRQRPKICTHTKRYRRFLRKASTVATIQEGVVEDGKETNIFKVLRDRGLLDACTSEALVNETSLLPVRVYCGFDPTADSLHIGNLLGIIVLSWFQKYGHTPIALIGGATGRVGDPSGKSSERPMLDDATIDSNSQAIERTIRSILSNNVRQGESLIVVNNLEWYSSMSFLDFLRDVGKFSRMGTMLAKDSVKSRLASEGGISFTEFSYQLLQGYDFVHLFRHHGVSVQVGGSDQWGNITAGTDLIRRLEPAATVSGMTFPLLLKSDGTKFGKSEQGAIWLSAGRLSPYKFYQYFLGVDDADVIRLLRMLTFLPLSEISELEREMNTTEYVVNTAQIRLAEEITRYVHGVQGLSEAQAATNILKPGLETELDATALRTMVGLVPSAELPLEEVVGQSLVQLVVKVGLQPSKGATKRLIQGGGLRMNNNKITDDETTVTANDLVDGSLLLLACGKKNKLLLTVTDS